MTRKRIKPGKKKLIFAAIAAGETLGGLVARFGLAKSTASRYIAEAKAKQSAPNEALANGFAKYGDRLAVTPEEQRLAANMETARKRALAEQTAKNGGSSYLFFADHVIFIVPRNTPMVEAFAMVADAMQKGRTHDQLHQNRG